MAVVVVVGGDVVVVTVDVVVLEDVVLLVVVVVVVVTWEKPWIWTIVLNTEGSPCQVDTKRSLLIGSNSRPKGPELAFLPKPAAKSVSVGLAVPCTG